MGAPDQAAQGRLPPGAQAEALAAEFLLSQGVRLLARNVRYRGGEIDLIGLDQGILVFVEVRLRRNGDFGGALESIGRGKQQRIILAARHWLAGAGRRWADRPCRFDALLYDRLDAPAAQWLRDAFQADD